MKRIGFMTVLFLLLVNLGCACCPVTYVPVREARFRSESTRSDRIKLPLDSGSSTRLILFLKAGGDNDLIGQDIVDPEAEGKYKHLLSLLSDTTTLAIENLTKKGVFKEWFSDLIVRQVIDAREESPPVIDPVAVTDGRYWWIFYQQDKRLTELVVIKAIPVKIER